MPWSQFSKPQEYGQTSAQLRGLRSPRGKRQSNLFSVKSAVFNENLAGVSPADDDTRQIYTRNIAFV
jgi:hypothetical protein